MSPIMTSHRHRLLTNHLSHNLLHIHIELSLHSQLSTFCILQRQLDDHFMMLIINLVLIFYMYTGMFYKILKRKRSFNKSFVDRTKTNPWSL